MNFFVRNKRMLCMALVFCSVLTFTGCGGPGSEDPNWNKTHVTVTSVEEAVKQFGSDLLLDKLVLTEGYGKPYTEFILAHAGESSEKLKDRQTWRFLSIAINYGGERFRMDYDRISLQIFFKENDPVLIGSGQYPNDGYKNMLQGSTATKRINEYTVTYREYSSKEFAYSFCGEFKYNEYIYFLESYSHKNPNLAWNTLKQMLGS